MDTVVCPACIANLISFWCVCVYYCSTYYKAVRVGVGGTVEDMCYERLRSEACVDCVKEGGGEEGEHERERAREVRLHYSLGY
jgi:hypothetical protein